MLKNNWICHDSALLRMGLGLVLDSSVVCRFAHKSPTLKAEWFAVAKTERVVAVIIISKPSVAICVIMLSTIGLWREACCWERRESYIQSELTDTLAKLHAMGRPSQFKSCVWFAEIYTRRSYHVGTVIMCSTYNYTSPANKTSKLNKMFSDTELRLFTCITYLINQHSRWPYLRIGYINIKYLLHLTTKHCTGFYTSSMLPMDI